MSAALFALRSRSAVGEKQVDVRSGLYVFPALPAQEKW
jgi:hypothetical protein